MAGKKQVVFSRIANEQILAIMNFIDTEKFHVFIPYDSTRSLPDGVDDQNIMAKSSNRGKLCE